MPLGVLETVPVPVPARVTLNGKEVKVAVTCWLVFIVTTQVRLVPLQPPPLQPVKEDATGVAVSVTFVPTLKFALH
jgi:hypothetical protein